MLAADLGQYFGHERVYQLAPSGGDDVDFYVRSRVLFDKSATYNELKTRIAQGAVVDALKMDLRWQTKSGTGAIAMFVLSPHDLHRRRSEPPKARAGRSVDRASRRRRDEGGEPGIEEERSKPGLTYRTIRSSVEREAHRSGREHERSGNREAVMGLGLNAPPRAPPDCLGHRDRYAGPIRRRMVMSDKDMLMVLAASYDSRTPRPTTRP